ncbi:MAG: hypothetical protein EPO07_19705 [Verrucomicrobia bacterium]|nr:MAG: hypothetical protein EPO07_19705 [Verrucomicrobiota bacterium]
MKTNTRATTPAHWSATTTRPSASPSGAYVIEDAEVADVWPRADDDAQSKHARSKKAKAEPASQSWLARDPFEWVGRKIRSKKTGTVFTVRNVFRNGRVELEKSWMTYSYTVEVIREDFETNS